MAYDILEVLTEDHRRVEGILGTLTHENDPNECLSLLHDLTMELLTHMRGEERILYPRLPDAPGGAVLEDEAEEQHAMAEELLGELVGMASSGSNGSFEGFRDKVAQLSMALNEHITFEENEIFPRCRETFSAEELASFAAELDDVKLEVQSAMEQVAAGVSYEEVTYEAGPYEEGGAPEQQPSA